MDEIEKKFLEEDLFGKEAADKAQQERAEKGKDDIDKEVEAYLNSLP